ncbi:MAG: hypothetical protein GWP91_06865, partial [Rhodobacterales bacterium]|nr:hypothetical protein [Rhodobacterales bacterium]
SAAIKAYTGNTFYYRGLSYYQQGRVSDLVVTSEWAAAKVVGSEGMSYWATAFIDHTGIHGSECECPVRGTCKHVAATLILFEDSQTKAPLKPFSASEEPLPEQEVLQLTTRQSLREWARANGVMPLLDRRITSLLTGDGQLWHLAREFPSVEALLTATGNFRNGWWEDYRSQTQFKCATALLTHRDHRKKADEYRRKAEEWRSVAPEEPALHPLWRWLRDGTEPLDEDRPNIIEPIDTTRLSVQPDPPLLLIQHGHYGDASHVSLQPTDRHDAKPYAIETLLDVLTLPALNDHPIRVEVLKQVAIPLWQRTLAALDQLVVRAEPGPQADIREIGWKITEKGKKLDVAPVRCTPYKNRAGLRTAKTKLRDCPLPLSADKRAAEILGEDVRSWQVGREQSRQNRALEALVGHPRVILGKGHLMAVRKSTMPLAWQPTEAGGVRLTPQLSGRPLTDVQVEAVLDTWSAGLAVLLEPNAQRITVIDLPETQLNLLKQLNVRGSEFPAASMPALMERFESLNKLAPMTLAGALRGDRVDGDSRPLLRLSPAVDGSLEVAALSRPLPNTTPWIPGEGPAEISAFIEGKRVFCRRTLADEPAQFEAILSTLGLTDDERFEWAFDNPDDGLSTLLALRESGDKIRVEWTKPAPHITRPATADDLRVQGVKKRDWFGLTGGLNVDGAVISLADLLEAVRQNRRFVAVKDGGWVALTQRLRTQLETTAALSKAVKEGVELPMLATAALLPLEEDGADLKLPKTFRVQMDRLHQAETLHTDIPATLVAQLRPYQVDGFQWMARLAHWAPGAVLADDMGLGKTIQALTLLLHRAKDGPALVVAPASVGINWSREAERFAPSLKVQSYRGSKRAKLLHNLGPQDVLITSWELMTRDAKALAEAQFHTVVMDEAQAIKNANTRRARASADLNAHFTLALTGTPIENRVGEVWSLFRTAVPGLLGSAQRFRSQVVIPIERDGLEQPRRALAQLLRPFLLRRVKSEVAKDLPARTDAILHIELSAAERTQYDAFRSAALAELNTKGKKQDKQRFQILAALTRLRQLACHPALVSPENAPPSSTKVERLVEALVDLKQGGHHSLVFSQFTKLLGLARVAIEKAGLTVRYLDGSTSMKKRQAEVDAFQDGSGDVFLISLKAGGTGLNLTQASYVFHLDPWWNPAVEDQATDRAHRIGQTQPVNVFRLVATDTIEEQVIAMHQEKRALVADLLSGTGKSAALSTQELMTVLQGDLGRHSFQ